MLFVYIATDQHNLPDAREKAKTKNIIKIGLLKRNPGTLNISNSGIYELIIQFFKQSTQVLDFLYNFFPSFWRACL
jgi:hypothetical protein